MPGRRPARLRGGPSQHFLRRGALASSLVCETDFASTDRALEIGAGLGALTAPLAERFEHVCAVEIDPGLCVRLRQRFARAAGVDVVAADFFDLGLPATPYAAVGNLPFHRSAEILGRLVCAPNPPHDILAIVEDRAAFRHAGHPFAGESLRSLWLKIGWQIEITRRLAPGVFDPPPSVGAAVLWMARRQRPLIRQAQERDFRDLTATIFAGPTLTRVLRTLFTPTQIRRLARDYRFAPDARPSELAMAQWLGIFRAFHREVPRARQKRVRGARNRLPRVSSLAT